MAQMTREEVLKSGTMFLTVPEFIEQYAKGLSSQAIYYAMDKGLIDWMSPARERYAVLTRKTLNYAPNSHPTRGLGGKGGKSTMQT